MKFGHVYQELLQDGFPQHWVESAISYRQLKKCIKRVEKELSELGLDAETLSQLLRSVEHDNPAEKQDDEDGRPFKYLLAGADVTPPDRQNARSSSNQETVFQPKLLFAVDEVTGEPLDARLSPETKNYLHQLAIRQRMTDVRVVETLDVEVESGPSDVSFGLSRTQNGGSSLPEGSCASSRALRMIEIPLTSDSEFFGILQTQLSGLAQLQAEEQQRLSSDVSEVSQSVSKITKPDSKSSKHDLNQWRRIFELYLESKIFFSASEQDHGTHNSSKAQLQLQKFSDTLHKDVALTKFKRKESLEVLDQFLQLNFDLLQSLKFQELNQTAMTKILKKFDKRTALGVKTTFPAALSAPLLSQDIAKAVCYQVSTELLPVVPQLDDYLCPVCFTISWRPVRLRCRHIFCIRCLIVMQRANEDHCPLCRGAVIMEADSTNLDPELVGFLLKYFPNEVKAKQKENERAAGVDRYGEAYNDRCCVM